MNIKDFKTGNTTNSLVSYNILTNHTLEFQLAPLVLNIESNKT